MTFGDNKWDGKERRVESRETKDLLVNMDKNLALLAQSTQQFRDEFKKHVDDDALVHKEFREMKGKMTFYAGCFAVIVFIIGMVPKFIK